MSFSQKYLNNPMGRTALIAFFLSLFFAYMTFIIPLAPVDTNAWYSFLYSDITLPAEERFNWGLVLLESLFFTLFYLFFVIALGAYAEVQNRLPSWTELLVSGIVTMVIAWIFPQISVGEGSIEGVSGTGFNHFTETMQTVVFWFTLLGVILMSFYLYHSGPKEE